MKRALDVIVTLCLAPAILPLIAFLALLVKVSSKGPVIYWSQRVGRDNRLFWMPKLRTMRTEAPEVATHLLEDPKRWITGIGRVLRRTSLDELPQFWNVLRGEMTLVGPRPALHNQQDLVTERTKVGLSSLTPGVTGWAQINGRDELSIPQKVACDKWYADNKTLWIDLRVIFLTALSVLKAMRLWRSEASMRATSTRYWSGVATLFVLALVLRSGLAVKNNVPCRDGIYYLAQATDRELPIGGPSNRGHGRIPLEGNLFPLFLRGCYLLGWNPFLVGKWTNVLLASLVVIPLCQLLRAASRMAPFLNKDISKLCGLVSGFLYATHTELIEWSTELVRDPSFWLLFVTTLWGLWSLAYTRSKVWIALALGGILAATCIRVEAVTLVFPLVIWALYSRRQDESRGARITRILAVPFTVMIVGGLFLSSSMNMESLTLRTPYLTVAKKSMEAMGDGSVDSRLISAWAVAGRGFIENAGILLPFLLLGLNRNAGYFRSRLFFGLVPCFGVVGVGIFLHCLATGSTTPRYFTLPIILSIPFCSFSIVTWMMDMRDGKTVSLARKPVVSLLVAMCIGVAIAKVVSKDYSHRTRKLEIAQWVLSNTHEGVETVCTEDLFPYIAHYTSGSSWCLSEKPNVADLKKRVYSTTPEWIVLSVSDGEEVQWVESIQLMSYRKCESPFKEIMAFKRSDEMVSEPTFSGMR